MINKTLLSIIVIAAAFVLSAWVFSDIFTYVCISMVFATLLRPMTNVISRVYIFRKRVSRVVAALLSLLTVVVVVSSFVLLFIPLIIEQISVISNLSFELIYNNLSQPIIALENKLIEYQLVNPEKHNLTDTFHTSMLNFLKNIDFQNILNNLLTITSGVLVSILAIAFITFFLLYENGILNRLMISVVPNQYFELFISAFHKIEKLLSNYLIGLLVQMFSIFTISSIGLTILGVKYAISIAVFAAVANLIPYLGPILGTIFGILVGVSTGGHEVFDDFTLMLVIKIASVFAFVQAVDNIILQPLIFSKSVKAHPLEIFVVIFAAATIAGIPGMIAAIPVYTIIRVSVMEIRSGFKSYKVFQISK